MTSTHHLPVNVETQCEELSTAYWRRGSARKLVFFIHGFGGDARSTWSEFPSLLTQWADKENEAIDLVLYQYDSCFSQATSNAGMLRSFLQAFLQRPELLVNSSLPPMDRRPAFEYEKVIFVAHSLGSVVLRRALLELERYQKDERVAISWLSRVAMILYAPAHRGARAAKLALSIASEEGWSLTSFLSQAIHAAVPALEELQPDSDVIKDLKETVSKILDEDKQRDLPHVKAKVVVWAGKERVVVNDHFPGDPLSMTEGRHHHTSVCKPRSSTENIFSYVATSL